MSIRNHRLIYINAVILIFFATFVMPCFAQIWPVKTILENIQSPGVVLKNKEGAELARMPRRWIEDVDKVTSDLAPVYGLDTPRMYIAKQNGPNAFVTLDHGTPIMVVNTDMLKLIGDDRDLMAVVVGHELGHLKAGHLTQGHAIQQVISVVGKIVGAIFDAKEASRGVNTGGIGNTLGAVGANLVNAKFGRDQEREADDLGIRYMAKAGYDPNAAPRLWKLMEEQGGGGSGLWFSSHPSSSERFETLASLAAAMSGTYNENRGPERQLARYDDPYPPAKYTSLVPSLSEMSQEPLGPYARARALYKEGQFDIAFPFLKEAAESGDERAITLVGVYFQNGLLGSPDYVKARANFEEAANRGVAAGILYLGAQSVSGKGAPMDINEATRLFTIAAARNEPRAYGVLALMYVDGNKAIARDPIMARQLAEKAAESGDAYGRGVLGFLLRQGIGGTTDKARSFALLNLAVDDDKLAFYAQYQLGLSYEVGAGTPVNKEKAIELYKLASSHGYAPPIKRLEALGVKQ